MSQKAETSISFSIKKKVPSKVVDKNSLQTTKKSELTEKQQEKASAKRKAEALEHPDNERSIKSAKSLEEDAIKEILRDTKRGATRAEISGSWLPPSARINSRLFNNTLVQALQSNRRQTKQPKRQKT